MLADFAFALSLGIATGVLAIASVRLRIAWLGWVVLVPVGIATYSLPPLFAGVAGAIAGVLVAEARIWGVYHFARVIEGIEVATCAVVWGAVFALAAWLWPEGTPAGSGLILPVSAGLVSAIPQAFAGRQDSPLLATQERVLPVVHVARLGGDAMVPALLGLAASIPTMLVAEWPPSIATIAVAIAALVVLTLVLAFGLVSYRRAAGFADNAPRLRVAAVAIDPPPRPGSMFAAMTDEQLDATTERYERLVTEASKAGTRLIVLPEMAAVVTTAARERWLAAVSSWAKRGQVTIVADDFDAEARRNRLEIVDETGRIAVTYDKQHPMPSIEPAPPKRMTPALHPGSPTVSGVICHDLDLGDWVRPVRRAGGVLAVPANDWQAIAEIHHRVTVWAAVMAGVPIVRAASHGTSAIFDAAGRIVAEASSSNGPVMLVADVAVAR